jgi:hypothetical protein
MACPQAFRFGFIVVSLVKEKTVFYYRRGAYDDYGNRSIREFRYWNWQIQAPSLYAELVRLLLRFAGITIQRVAGRINLF